MVKKACKWQILHHRAQLVLIELPPLGQHIITLTGDKALQNQRLR